jgi:3-dehydroquinate dehydratase-1
MNTVHIGHVELGRVPRVVGTITMRASLPASGQAPKYDCAIVEVRLDLIGSDTPHWLAQCRAIEASGHPVLLTLRLANEGGKWMGPDQNRLPYITSAQEGVSCVDVEFLSGICGAVCEKAAQLGKPVIVSYHNFQRTPPLPELEDILGKMRELPAAIPKLTTMVTQEADIETLKVLLAKHRNKPLCVIGMGAKATETRVLFPTLGSCLTYGYIDSPSAPGQFSATELTRRLTARNQDC